MKSIKVLSALSLLALAGTANAEVTGSMGIASSYLWRGVDLGSGTPAVSGDLKLSGNGFYTGAWVSSGDTTLGTEYDLYAGYGGSVGTVTYDISYWTYAYPTNEGGDPIPPGDLAEVIGSIGVGPVSAFYNFGVSDLEDYSYYGVKAKLGAFGATLAKHDPEGGDGMVHVDVSYAVNDNLSFTVSKQVSNELDEDDLTLVASYTVPFGK